MFPDYLSADFIEGTDYCLDAQLDLLFDPLTRLERIAHRLIRSATQQRARVYGPVPLLRSLQWRGHCRYFPHSISNFTRSIRMGKKEEEDIIRIAKKIDKMAQKKNGVRYLRRMNA